MHTNPSQSTYTYPYCNNVLPDEVRIFFRELSQEQRESFSGMHELLCFHNRYGINESFMLETPNQTYENITIQKTIGEGGSKKAALLSNKMVIMFPNMDVDHFAATAKWWPSTVTKEAAMAEFLETIDVPALDRKKSYLHIPSSNNKEIIYKLPVLVSSSFEKYAEKGWFITDMKNVHSTIFSDEEWQNWKLKLEMWQEPVKPLIYDLWKLGVNGIKINYDCINSALVKNDNGNFEIRYFGFDFGGKRGTKEIPSEAVNINPNMQTKEEICNTVDSKKLADIITGFIDTRFWNENSKKFAGEISYSKKNDFSEQVGEHYSSCEFITQTLLGGHIYQHDEL